MKDFSNINTYLMQAKQELLVCNYNEVDALVLAQLSYYPFEIVIKRDKISVPELAKELMQIPDFESAYSQDKQTFIKELVRCKRYSHREIYRMQSIRTQDTRWAAFTVEAGRKDEAIIVMRGTGKTTVGWAEDFRLGYQVMGTGAQLASFRYLKETDAHKIYLTGHSKGGNNISSAFAMSNPMVRDKVVRIDNFDGPGVNPEFAGNYSDGYKELGGKLRNFYPEGSVIGLLLTDNPGKTSFIKTSLRESYQNSPLLGQHDPFAWEVKGNSLVRTKQSLTSEILNDTLDELIQMTTLTQRYYLVELIERMGIPAILSGEIQGVAADLTAVICGLTGAGKEEREALFYAVLAFLKGLVRRVKEWIATRVELLQADRKQNFNYLP
ncbi:MAG: DUF2974 domain-containing protein [Lachnospiraceae bacterium]|nr:DUF2974 domain-containing protein [Lachnospiraceae bacterium]